MSDLERTDIIPTFGYWTTASCATQMAWDLGFAASRIQIDNLDGTVNGRMYVTLGSTFASTSAGPETVTTSSGVYHGAPVFLVSTGESFVIENTGRTGVIAVALCSTGRNFKIAAFQ